MGKVLTTITVDNAEMKVLDAEQSTTGKTVQLEYPNKQADKISVDYKERILINFNVVDSLTKKAMLVHQAFIKLTHIETSAEIIYVGDAVITNPTSWHVADIMINFPAESEAKEPGLYS